MGTTIPISFKTIKPFFRVQVCNIGGVVKNKMCFIDGSLTPSADSIDHQPWHRCNNLIIGWLVASLDRYTAKSVMYFKTAHDIWLDLDGCFGKTSSSQLYCLQEKLTNTFQELGMSLTTYFTRVKTLWDELDDLCPLTICKCNPTTNFFKIQQNHGTVRSSIQPSSYQLVNAPRPSKYTRYISYAFARGMSQRT